MNYLLRITLEFDYCENGGKILPSYDLRERSKHLIEARKWGIGIITAALGLGLFVSEVKRIWHLPNDLNNWAYLALFLVCGSLVLVWIWCTQKELDLLFEWMDPQRYEPPSDLKETAAIVGLGILLVALVFASRNPIAFGIVFTTYSIAIMLSVIHLNRELSEVIFQTRRRIGVYETDSASVRKAVLLRLQGIEILEEYFITRPHTPRHIIILIFSAIGLALAIADRHFGLSVLRLVAYGVFILLIIISEVIIAHWRNVRDHKLRPVTAELNEIRRSQDELKAEHATSANTKKLRR